MTLGTGRSEVVLVSALTRVVALGLLLLCGMLSSGAVSAPHHAEYGHEACTHVLDDEAPCLDDAGCTGHLAHAALPDPPPMPHGGQCRNSGIRALDHRLPKAPDLAPDPPPIQAV